MGTLLLTVVLFSCLKNSSNFFKDFLVFDSAELPPFHPLAWSCVFRSRRQNMRSNDVAFAQRYLTRFSPAHGDQYDSGQCSEWSQEASDSRMILLRDGAATEPQARSAAPERWTHPRNFSWRVRFGPSEVV